MTVNEENRILKRFKEGSFSKYLWRRLRRFNNDLRCKFSLNSHCMLIWVIFKKF